MYSAKNPSKMTSHQKSNLTVQYRYRKYKYPPCGIEDFPVGGGGG